MVFPAYLTPYLPLLFTAGALAALGFSQWALVFPRVAIGFLAASLALGQLVRFPLPGQGGGLLLSDVAVILVLGSATLPLVRLLKKTVRRAERAWFQFPKGGGERGPRSSADATLGRTTRVFMADELRLNSNAAFQYALLFMPFLLWGLAVLIMRSSSYPAFITDYRLPITDYYPFLIAASYWLRLAIYLAVLPALLFLAERYSLRSYIKRAFWWVVGAVLLLGVLQLVFAADLSALALRGWDPHQFRLVSTWLDPNFLGAFLGLSILMALAQVVQRSSPGRWVGVAALFIALGFTQSRTSLLAILATLVVGSLIFLTVRGLQQPLSPRRALQVSLASGFLVVWLLLAGFLLGERLRGFWQYDPTVDLRLTALASAWDTLVQQHAWVGVGYNTYQFAAADAGLISGFTIHSRAGADNSWLTLWVTTGLVGVCLFALPWLFIEGTYLRTYIREVNPLYLAGALSIFFLFIHAQFVNSFLYPHLLLTLIFVLVITAPPNLVWQKSQ